MFKRHLAIAARRFRNNKGFSLINVFGLAIGISASLVIYLIVSYDFGFDKFEPGQDRIYRVVADYDILGRSFHAAGIPHALPGAISREIPGVETLAPIRLWDNGIKVSIAAEEPGTRTYKNERDIVFADRNYFNLVPYQWLAGSKTSSLEDPYHAVITESRARLYFGNVPVEEAIGKVIIFNDTVHLKVTGIVKDLAGRTDLSFKTFISRTTLETERLNPKDGDEWTSAASESQLLLKLSSVASAEQAEDRIDGLFRMHPLSDAGVKVSHHLQPLDDIHFNADYGAFDNRVAHKPSLYGLLAVAGFLLLLAAVNFINLNTAQASRRAKEIGIRKTMGSGKYQLVSQFLSETFLLTFFAGVLALGLTPVMLAQFADFVPQSLHFNPIQEPGILLFWVLLILLVSLLAGFYPALVLSSFKPVLTLRGLSEKGESRSGLRKSLMVSQFVIAQVFVIATLLVGKQVKYSLYKDLGFKKDAVVYFTTSYTKTGFLHRPQLMDKLKAMPEIAAVSLSNNPPTSIHDQGVNLEYIDGKLDMKTHAEVKLADTNYIGLYQIKLLAGRNIGYSDTIRDILINETGVRALGFSSPGEAVGKRIIFEKKKVSIVGVIGDLHHKSLREKINPLIISSKIRDQGLFNVALKRGGPENNTWAAALGKMAAAFKEVYPNDDFEYHFLDESIADYYTAEKRVSVLLWWATALSMVISCLGLFGLVLFITNSRAKEIGVRKVLGAKVIQIVSLLAKDFLKLTALAFIIAVPMAWFGTNRWLEGFAYRTSLDWWIFLAGGGIMLIAAMAALCTTIIKAASANPVESLKAE